MKLSWQWLAEHVDLAGLDPEAVAEQLTLKTALIEFIERPGDALRNVVVGAVLECGPHPDADRLKVCQVDTGQESVTVVCGAPNVEAGQKIAYAPVGTVLPIGLKLEARKIRGILSHGMICAEDEMGLGDDHDGIVVLDAEAPVGRSLVEHLDLDDVIFDIDNTSVTHRPDLWSHYGFARELAAIFQRELRDLAVLEELAVEAAGDRITVEDLTGCPVYFGLRFTGADAAAASPRWMQRRLQAAGMRPLQLLVDLSNYVMLELGQPTHPFDFARLGEQRIVVRRAREGERLTTLDGQDRELVVEDLVIADGKQAVAIAGIMGGGDSEISAATEEGLLESASFDAVSVRRTAARLGLRTDALARFEKFLDPALAEIGARRFAYLLKQLCPAVKFGGLLRAGQAADGSRSIRLRPDRVRGKLGYDLPTAEISDHLRRIGMGVTASEDALVVTVPSLRAGRDLEHEDDLIEEVGRLAGYERVPTVLPHLNIAPPPRDALRVLQRAVIQGLVHGCGYTEVMCYSFATDRQMALYHDAEEPFLSVPNPITADASHLRRSLVPGMLEHLARNQLHRAEVRLLEVGRCYLPEEAEGELPRERRDLVAVRWLSDADPATAVLAARSDLEQLFGVLRRPLQSRSPEGRVPAFAHPGRSLELVVQGAVVGYLAQLHPRLAQSFGVAGAAAVLQLDLQALAEQAPVVVQPRPLPQFPAVLRDISVEAEERLQVAEIQREIRAAGQDRIAAVELFDVYQGKGIAPGHRSLAFRLEFRAEDRTLTDEEVERVFQRVIQRLAKRDVRLRGE